MTPTVEPPARTKPSPEAADPRAVASEGRADDTEPTVASEGDTDGSHEASEGAARIYKAL